MNIATAFLQYAAILVAAPLLLTHGKTDVRKESYCDVAYNYCIYFPSQVFEETDSSTQGEQRLRLYDRDGDITVTVTVVGNGLDLDFRRLYEQQALELQEQFPNLREIESAFLDDYMEATFENAEQRLYYISYRMTDQLVTIALRAPLTLEEAAFERLKSAIYLTSNT